MQSHHPRGHGGSGFLAFVVLASLHGVLRRVARSRRSSSLHLQRDLLPVAFSLADFLSSYAFSRIVDNRELGIIRPLASS